MPSGLPSAQALLEDKSVGFFSIDTDVIQSHAYKFSAGALRALPLQRPAWLTIQQTEIVEREVHAHRMEPVSKVAKELNAAIAKLQRLSGLNFTPVSEQVKALDSESVTARNFSREFSAFVASLGGGVLPIAGPDLARQMFDRYFQEAAPFEARKKSEFPDAAALLTLENHAKATQKQGILISRDGGWTDFAKHSDWLYCVKSLDEFAALFKSTNPVAAGVTAKVSAELSNTASSLSTLVQAAVENHVAGAYWNADDVWTGFCHRVEAEVDQAHYLGHSVDLTGIGIWLVEHDPTICIIEVRATVQVSVDVNVEFFVYDTIDHEELNFGSLEVTRDHELEVDMFITLRGDLELAAVDELDPSIELAGGEYDVEVGEVEPDFDEEP
ncbi:PIN domain-containing protein [Limnohabitans sp.]|uniref:PIN domain-containing protein n=1 Tax=Limnohabitans sp. TaxID=1907725 RepID=UPI00286F708E|nr:PIN domain-containing protein [Limnohabitans sp.]